MVISDQLRNVANQTLIKNNNNLSEIAKINSLDKLNDNSKLSFDDIQELYTQIAHKSVTSSKDIDVQNHQIKILLNSIKQIETNESFDKTQIPLLIQIKGELVQKMVANGDVAHLLSSEVGNENVDTLIGEFLHENNNPLGALRFTYEFINQLAQDILNNNYFTSVDLANQNLAIDATLRELDTLYVDIEKTDFKRDEQYKSVMLNKLNLIKEKLPEKASYNEKQIASDPFRKENTDKLVRNFYNAAIATARDIQSAYKDNGKTPPKELTAIIDNAEKQLYQYFSDTKSSALLTKDQLKDLKKKADSLSKELAEFSSKGVISSSQIKKLYKQNRLDDLNTDPNSWGEINKEINLTEFGKDFKVKSVITPVINTEYANQPLKNSNIRGVTSLDRQTVHAVNLSTTKMYDSNGKLMFSGLRHGTNCAFGIDNAQERRTANTQRAREIVLAALANKPNLMQDALAGKEVTLDLVSVSLMTPGSIFGRKEYQYVTEQMASWNDVKDDKNIVKDLVVTDENGNKKTLKVKLNVLPFSYGVDNFAVSITGKGLSFGGGWGYSEPINQASINTLFELAKQKSNSLSPSDKKLVDDLIAQTKELINKEAYKDGTKYNPYAIPANIAIIAEKLGLSPCFNCKSGKDRTSMMDAQIKSVLARFEYDGTVVKEDDEKQKKIFKHMIFEGGNFEIQKYNTGLSGYKLHTTSYWKGVDYVRDLLTEDEKRAHVGASKAVPS